MEGDTQKCPPSCIKPPQCPLVHISSRPISPHISHSYVPSPPCANADNEMVRCAHEDTCKCPRLCHKSFQGLPVHIFFCFWAISLPTQLPFAVFSLLPLLLRLPLPPVRLMALAPATEDLLSKADLAYTNLHVTPLIIAPCLYGIDNSTALWPVHARFSIYDAGAGKRTCTLYAQIPPRSIVGVRTAPVLGTVTLWPVAFQLSPQAAIANFGLTRTAPHRHRAPRSTKNYQNYRQVWP